MSHGIGYPDYLDSAINLRKRPNQLQVTRKTDGSPVSNDDLRLEALAFEWATANYPGFNVLSEESPLVAKLIDTSSVVVVDPIDGTENYISGLPLWASGVSVFERGRHIYSAITAPAMGMHLESSDFDSNKDLEKHISRVVGFSSSTRPSAIPDDVGEYRVFGCSMLNFLFAIQGSFSEFRNDAGAHCWDILPGLNLALAAGLDVRVEEVPYQGEFLPPGRKYRFSVSNQDSEGD